MICSSCGTRHETAVQYCTRCGTHMAAAPVQPGGYGTLQGVGLERGSRVAQNVRALGILWCFYGVYRAMRAIAGMAALHAVAHSGMFGDAPPFFVHLATTLGPALLVTSLLMAALSGLAGFGLLTRQPWARTLAIVVAILSLIKLPVGTAVGIYTLWVLAPSASGQQWREMQEITR